MHYVGQARWGGGRQIRADGSPTHGFRMYVVHRAFGAERQCTFLEQSRKPSSSFVRSRRSRPRDCLHVLYERFFFFSFLLPRARSFLISLPCFRLIMTMVMMLSFFLRFVTPPPSCFLFFPSSDSCPRVMFGMSNSNPPPVDVGSNEFSLERVSGTGDTRSSFIPPY